MKVLVTDGVGFIRSVVIRNIIHKNQDSTANRDKLTCVDDFESIDSMSNNERYIFELVDTCDCAEIVNILEEHRTDVIMHVAAERHIVRSIYGPEAFVENNAFRFCHISTGEVYVDLEVAEDFSAKNSAYAPSSPYSVPKESSYYLIRAWLRNYIFSTIFPVYSKKNCLYHFPKKLTQLVLLNSLEYFYFCKLIKA